MITKEDLGPFMFNEKVEQLLKERDEALAQLKAAEEKAEAAKHLAISQLKFQRECELIGQGVEEEVSWNACELSVSIAIQRIIEERKGKGEAG